MVDAFEVQIDGQKSSGRFNVFIKQNILLAHEAYKKKLRSFFKKGSRNLN